MAEVEVGRVDASPGAPPGQPGAARRVALRVAGHLGNLVVVVLLASVLTFLLASLLPGDPAVAILGPDRAPEDYARVRTELGLDDPLPTRYLDWLGGVLHGDLGRSLIPPNAPVWDRLSAALPVSLELAGVALGGS